MMTTTVRSRDKIPRRMIRRVGGRLIDQAFDPPNARNQSLEACNHTYDLTVPCLFRLSIAFSTMPIGNNTVGKFD